MPLGYDPSNTMMISVAFDPGQLKSWAERVARLDAVQENLQHVPGVLSLTSAADIPPSGPPAQPFELVGETSLRPKQAEQDSVGQNYFSQLHIPLLEGRLWTSDEEHEGIPLAVVNATFARRFSPNRSLLGRTVRLLSLDLKDRVGAVLSPALNQPEVEIVGVVGDAVNDGLDKPVLPAIYLNDTLILWPGKLFFVHTAGPPAEYSRQIALAAHSAAGKSFLYIFPDSLQDFVEHEPMWRTQRLVSVLLGIFAVFALALSLVGLYSVVSFVVARRTSEFGIRLALGANRGGILALVLRSNAGVILCGVAIGLLFSFAVRARFAHWSEYSSRDPLLTCMAALLLVAAAILASLLPAYRASRVEPSVALRAE